MEYWVIPVAERSRGAEGRRLFTVFAALAGLLCGLFPQFARSGLALVFIGALTLAALLTLFGDWLDERSLR